MLILNKQIEKLEWNEKFDLATQAYEHLKDSLPDEIKDVSKNDFIITANRQISNAKNYGITDSTAQLKYILVAFIFGEEFDKDIKILNDILTEKSINNTEKSESLGIVTIEIFKVFEE